MLLSKPFNLRRGVCLVLKQCNLMFGRGLLSIRMQLPFPKKCDTQLDPLGRHEGWWLDQRFPTFPKGSMISMIRSDIQWFPRHQIWGGTFVFAVYGHNLPIFRILLFFLWIGGARVVLSPSPKHSVLLWQKRTKEKPPCPLWQKISNFGAHNISNKKDWLGMVRYALSTSVQARALQSL